MTETEVRTVLLQEFAALTRHKPPQLTAMFRVYAVWPDENVKVETVRLEITYGKRSATQNVPGDAMRWEADRFVREIAKPLARELFESA